MAVTAKPISQEYGVRLNTGTASVPKSRFVSLGQLATGAVSAQTAVNLCKLLAANLEPPVLRYERGFRDELIET